MTAVRITLQVLLVITSAFLILLILLHKGRGGGLSDMFGGGVSSHLGSSGVAERNLNRFTVAVVAGLGDGRGPARGPRALQLSVRAGPAVYRAVTRRNALSGRG